MRVSYDSWMAGVRRRLIHSSAIKCVSHHDVFAAWWKAGFTPARVARQLNERWRIQRERESEA